MSPLTKPNSPDDQRLSPLERPVFIVGSGRCGSTLVQRLLNSNPEFQIWGEHAGVLKPIASAYHLATGKLMKDILDLQIGAVDVRDGGLRDPDRWTGWDNAIDQQSLHRVFREFVLSLFVLRDRSPVRWGFKEIRYGWKRNDRTLLFLHDIFPHARSIIVIRDPVSTITSMLLAWWSHLHLSSWDIDKIILKQARDWTKLYERLFLFSQSEPSASMIVRYEDLQSIGPSSTVSNFLRTNQEFTNWGQVLKVKQDESSRAGDFSVRVQERLSVRRSKVMRITSEVRKLYGYSD